MNLVINANGKDVIIVGGWIGTGLSSMYNPAAAIFGFLMITIMTMVYFVTGR